MICTTYFLTFFSELIPPTGKLYCFIVVFIYDCYYPIYSKGGTIISSEPKGTIIHERETGNFKLFIVAVTL